ncbi:MAG: hypothetical protein PHR81_03180 [Bacteroidales bacterium]|jgi:hypothetical protein|nr:hypothetical protein [Bacteroidales bacterium]MDD4213793.1 hypothetical protein [Bacteroidales bacterium]
MENSAKLQSTESEVKEGKVIETTRPSQENLSDEKLKIKRHKFDSLTIYEVSESELEIIEKGSPSSIYLNFAIFLISVAASFLVSLLTSDYTNKQNTFIVFLVITIVGFMIGIFLIILWLRTKNDFDQTIKKIKDRVS